MNQHGLRIRRVYGVAENAVQDAIQRHMPRIRETLWIPIGLFSSTFILLAAPYQTELCPDTRNKKLKFYPWPVAILTPLRKWNWLWAGLWPLREQEGVDEYLIAFLWLNSLDQYVDCTPARNILLMYDEKLLRSWKTEAFAAIEKYFRRVPSANYNQKDTALRRWYHCMDEEKLQTMFAVLHFWKHR